MKLHVILETGNLEIVKLLIENGAKVYAAYICDEWMDGYTGRRRNNKITCLLIFIINTYEIDTSVLRRINL